MHRHFDRRWRWVQSALYAAASLLAALTSLSPAQAAPPPVEGGPTDSRLLLYNYGQCLVDADRKRLEFLLDKDLNGRAFQKWRRNLGSDCLFSSSENGYFVMPDWASLRFVLADLIARPTVGQVSRDKLATLAPLALPTGPDTFGDARALKLGECLVRGSPESAAQLLRSVPNSDVEKRSVDTLLNEVHGCGLGQRVVIDIVSLRGAVAMSYFRLVKAGAPTQQRGAK